VRCENDDTAGALVGNFVPVRGHVDFFALGPILAELLQSNDPGKVVLGNVFLRDL